LNRFYHSKPPINDDEEEEDEEDRKENDFSKSNSNGSNGQYNSNLGASGSNDASSILQIKRELYERSKQLKSALSGMNN
jgi:hypothetical protein